MPDKKYIIDNKTYSESELNQFAKKNNLSPDEFIKASGAQEQQSASGSIYISSDNKEYDDNSIAEFAKKNNLSPDEFIAAAGLKKKDNTSPSSKPSTEVAYPPTNAFKEQLGNGSQSQLPSQSVSAKSDAGLVDREKQNIVAKTSKESLQAEQDFYANKDRNIPDQFISPATQPKTDEEFRAENAKNYNKTKIIRETLNPVVTPEIKSLTSTEKKNLVDTKLVEAGLVSQEEIIAKQQQEDALLKNIDELAAQDIGIKQSDYNKSQPYTKTIEFDGGLADIKLYPVNNTEYGEVDNKVIKWDGSKWAEVTDAREIEQFQKRKELKQSDFFDVPQNITKNSFETETEKPYVLDVNKYLYYLKEKEPNQYNYYARQLLGYKEKASDSNDLQIQKTKQKLIQESELFKLQNKNEDFNILVNRVGGEDKIKEYTSAKQKGNTDYLNQNFSPAQQADMENILSYAQELKGAKDAINFANKNITPLAYKDEVTQQVYDAAAHLNDPTSIFNPAQVLSVVDAGKSVWNLAVKGANGIVQLPKKLDRDNEYGFLDFFSDDFNRAAENVSMRTANRQLLNNGEVDAYAILPLVANGVASMYLLGKGSNALSKAGLSYNTGLLASSFALQHNDYYQQAQGKMSDEQANNFSIAAAGLTSLLELISPGEAIWGEGAGKITLAEAIDQYAKGKSFKEIVSPLVKEIGSENLQEVSQDLGDRVVNGMANTIVGKDVLDTTYNLNDFVETVAATTLATGLSGGFRGVGMSAATREDVVNKLSGNDALLDIALSTIQTNADSGLITQDKASELTQELTQRNTQLKALPDTFNDNKKSAIIDLQNQLSSFQKQEYTVDETGNVVKQDLTVPEQKAVEELTTKIEDFSSKPNEYFDNLKLTTQEKAKELLNNNPGPIIAELSKVGDGVTPVQAAQSIGKIENAAKELQSTELPSVTFSEVIDMPVTFKGDKGTIIQDGQTLVFRNEGGTKEYEIGNVDELSDKNIEDYNISNEKRAVTFNDNGELTIGEKVYVNNYSNPFQAINYGENGVIKSVELNTPEGRTATFKGQIAEDIAYQIHLQEINKDNQSKEDFLNHINNDEQAQEEINNGGIPEVTKENTDEGIAAVPREKIEPVAKEVSQVDFTGKDNNFLANKEPGFFSPEERATYNELMKTSATEGEAAQMINNKKEELRNKAKVVAPEKIITPPQNEKAEAKSKEAKVLTPKVEGIIEEIQDYTKAKEERKENVLKHFQFDLKTDFISKNKLPKETIDDENFIKAWSSGILSNANGIGLNEINPKLIKEAIKNPQPFIDAYNDVNKKYAGKNGFIEDTESAKKELLNKLPKVESKEKVPPTDDENIKLITDELVSNKQKVTTENIVSNIDAKIKEVESFEVNENFTQEDKQDLLDALNETKAKAQKLAPKNKEKVKEVIPKITDIASFKAAIKIAIPTLTGPELNAITIQAEALKNFAVKELGLSEEEAWKATQGDIVSSAEELGHGIVFNMNINGKEEKVRTLPEVTNGFYSPIEKRLLETKIEKQSVNKWKAIIGSGDEAKWTGVSAWLNTLKPDFPLTKTEILQHMKDNRIQVVEVIKTNDTIRISKDDVDHVDKTGDGWNVVFKNGGEIEVYTDNADNETEAIEVAVDEGNDNIGQLSEEELDAASGGGRTKFSQYVLPGEASNYREILVTMPNISTGFTYEVKNKNSNYPEWSENTIEKAQEYIDKKKNSGEYEIIKKKSFGKRSDDFVHTHFDEPNIIVHLRTNIRTDSEGNKVIFVEEIQSDYGQQGKKQGFKQENEDAWNIADKNYAAFMGKMKAKYGEEWMEDLSKSEVEEETRLLDKRENALGGKIPQAPFVTDTNSWVKLGLKTAIKYGVKEGAKKLVYTTGEQQNERYNLSNYVDRILYTPNTDGTYEISVYDKYEPTKALIRNEDMTLEDVESKLGKDMAQKISDDSGEKINAYSNVRNRDTKNSAREIKGEGLKVGGKGMIGFYGSPSEGKLGIVGSVAESMFGKGSVKTTIIGDQKTSITYEKYDGTQDVFIIENYGDKVEEGDWIFSVDGNTSFVGSASSELSAEQALKEFRESEYPTPESAPSEQTVQHSIEITPDIRAEVESGLPLFQNKDEKTKGAANIKSGKTFYGKLADISTPLHESHHHFLGLVDRLASEGNEKAISIQRTVDQFTDSPEGEKFAKREGLINNRAVARQELFARSAEKYFLLGKRAGFSGRMTKVFEQFKTFLGDIYKGIKNSPAKIKLSPEMRSLFDSIYGKEVVDKEIGDKISGDTNTQINNFIKNNNDTHLLGREQQVKAHILQKIIQGKLILTEKALKKLYADLNDGTESREYLQRKELMSDAASLNKRRGKPQGLSLVGMAEKIATDLNSEINQDRYDSQDVSHILEDIIHDTTSRLGAFHEYKNIMEKAQNKNSANPYEDEAYVNDYLLNQQNDHEDYQNAIQLQFENNLDIPDSKLLELYNKYEDKETGDIDIEAARKELPDNILNNLINYTNEGTQKTPDGQAENLRNENTPNSITTKEAEGSLEKELDDENKNVLNDAPKTYSTTQNKNQLDLFYNSQVEGDYTAPGETVDPDEKAYSTTVRGVWRDDNYLPFNGTARVQSHADVAEIMKLLEQKQVEHFFAVYVDQDGNSHVHHLAMGGTSGVVVDAKMVFAGVNKFKAKKVYLVHNHPSGNLTASQQDVFLTDNIGRVLEKMNVDMEHVIMDTYKGEYTLLNKYGLDVAQFERQKRTPEKINLPVYTFDMMEVLSEPLGRVTRPAEIASIIQQFKFSALPKRAMLVLARNLNVVANVKLNSYNLEDIVKEFVDIPGGASIVLYGNVDDIKAIQKVQDPLNKIGVKILDFLQFNTSSGVEGAYKSYESEGLLGEVQDEYGTNSVAIPGNLEKELNSKIAKLKTEITAFNKQYATSKKELSKKAADVSKVDLFNTPVKDKLFNDQVTLNSAEKVARTKLEEIKADITKRENEIARLEGARSTVREADKSQLSMFNEPGPRKSLKELLSLLEKAKGEKKGNVPPVTPKEPVIDEEGGNDSSEGVLDAIKNFKPITGDEVVRDAAKTYVDQIGENADMPSVKNEFQQRLSLGVMTDMISDFIFKGGQINDIAKLLGDEKIDLTVRGLIDSAIRELVPLGVVSKQVSDTIAAQYSIKLRGRISEALTSLKSSGNSETISPIQQSLIYASIGKDFGSELEKVQKVLDEINNGVPQADGSVKIFNNDELTLSKEQIANLEKQVSDLQKELEAEKESNKEEPVARRRKKEASKKFGLIKENLTNKYGEGFLKNLSDKIEKIKC